MLPPSLSIPWSRKHNGVSTVGGVHSDLLCLLLPKLTHMMSLSRPRAARKYTGASVVGDVHSDTCYILLPKFMSPLSFSIPWDSLPLSTPPSWWPIPTARHCEAAASVVVPKFLISQTHCIFLVLRQRLRRHCQFRGPGSERLFTFGLLTSYFSWWRFALVTVGHASLTCLVWYIHCQKQMRCKLDTQRLCKEYTILWFKFNMCGLRH